MNDMCLSCERFRRCCAGTACPVWTGCVWKIKKEKNTQEDVKNDSRQND